MQSTNELQVGIRFRDGMWLLLLAASLLLTGLASYHNGYFNGRSDSAEVFENRTMKAGIGRFVVDDHGYRQFKLDAEDRTAE